MVLNQPELKLDVLSGRQNGRFPQWLFPARLIRQAGFMPDQLLLIYWPSKLILLGLAPLVLLQLQPAAPWWAWLWTGVFGFVSADLYLWRRRQRRRQRLRGSLSFFVDLMNGHLKSGSPVGQAFTLAARFGFEPGHPLAAEVRLISREVAAGQSFAESFARMYERTGTEEIRRLASVIEVGRSTGASIRDTLARQAEVLREQQTEINRKLLSQRSIMMLLAMMLVGMPMFGVIVLFPAAVKVFEIFTLLRALF
ncbi:type II secretion system F family protein [Marinobacter sp. SS21]|uniref:type II secretion system F family protein n=1 Tax=Marinobacter sp. SS21 TaxID=2979460 RepID=UPI00232BF704|nr:type II secretion system F family protein [Marinobacter sp. SS21]MDC0662281.1 type II secretion system F family protein [Marinobacter sp. SS21]